MHGRSMEDRRLSLSEVAARAGVTPAPPPSSAMLLQHAINGLVLGSVYALIAVGFSLVFSVLAMVAGGFAGSLIGGRY